MIRTNLVINPSFEVDTSGWNTDNGGTLTRSTSDFLYGTACGQFITTLNDQWAGFKLPASTPFSKIYTWSVYVKGTVSETIHLYIYTGAADIPGSAITLTGAWQRLSQTVTTASSYGDPPSIQIRRSAGDTTNTILIDGAMIEAGNNLSTYIDGSQTDCQWDGAANASTSSRADREISGYRHGEVGDGMGRSESWT